MPKERAKLKAEVVDGKLKVPGDKTTYIREPIRTIYLDVTDLKLAYETRLFTDAIYRTASLRGTGKVDGDRLKLAGWGDACPSLSVSVKASPVGDDGKPVQEWRASIGFNPADWEIRTQDQWWCECLIPQADFDYMVACYRSDEVPRFTLNIKSLDLWIADQDEHAPIGFDVTWFLVPSAKSASDMPEMALGKLEGVWWNDAGEKLVPVNADDDQAEAPVATTESDEPRPDQAAAGAPNAELVAALGSLRKTIWKAGLLIVGALVVLWFK
jgi:hypothetical protein